MLREPCCALLPASERPGQGAALPSGHVRGRRGHRLVGNLALLLALCAAAPAAAAADPSAVIRRTAHGIPHISASDWEGLGYGYGFAFAQDNLCQIADSYVT